MVNAPLNPHVVCFLDILGYGELVSTQSESQDGIKEIEKAFKVALSLVEIAKIYKEPAALVAQGVKVRVLSDSVVLSMPLTGRSLLRPEFNEANNTFAHTVGFLGLISGFYTVLAAQLGYLLRGAITIGQYYDSALSEGKTGDFFLFSKALVEAVQLGKLAKNPRVLIGFSVFDHLNQLSQYQTTPERETLMGTTFRDIDKFVCLDIYSFMKLDEDPKKLAFLPQIVEQVRKQVKNHQADGTILEKYRWFADYHNRKLEGKPDCRELQIAAF